MKSLLSRPPLLLSLVLLGVFWLLLFYRLHTEWTVNTLYSYGWAVPLLALYLFSERWNDRPEPARDRPWAVWLVLPALLLLAYTPLRVVNEANPDWVKINFYLTSTVAAFSLAALFSIGRFRYMWHFAFPILFCFTALPWPVWMEEHLVQTLTRWDTNVSAELLTAFGIPAMATGNVIQIGNSMVNVEEACSGIRSLQTSFMMSLFLGEFYRMGLLSRGLLMVCSFVVAFGLNIARTMTLTYLSGAYGGVTMEKWHDTIGTAVMIGCLAGLWLLAVGFERFQKWMMADEPASAIPAKGSTTPITAPFPVAFAIFGLVALVGAEAFTEGWYSYHEARLAPPAEWSVHWPENAKNYKKGDFPDRTRAILKYNDAETARWQTEENYVWQMYYIRWYPGRVSKFLSSAHYPTVCLPATGLTFVSETGSYTCQVQGIAIPFTTFLFKLGETPVYVFHAILEDRPPLDEEKLSYHQVDSSERINSVLLGHRNLGQRVVGITITNVLSLEDAKVSVQKMLSEIIVNTGPAKRG